MTCEAAVLSSEVLVGGAFDLYALCDELLSNVVSDALVATGHDSSQRHDVDVCVGESCWVFSGQQPQRGIDKRRLITEFNGRAHVTH